MRKKFFFSVALLLPVVSLAQDARSVLATATKAMGADQLTTLQYSGSGKDAAFGQAYSPADPWPLFNVLSYTRSIDYGALLSRDLRVRTQLENPPRGGGMQPIIGERRQDQIVAVNAGTPWAQQMELWITPHGFLRAAAGRDVKLRSRTLDGRRYSVLSFVGDNGAPVDGYIGGDGLVERVETRLDNPVLGDMPVVAEFSDYRPYGAIRFPTHITQRQGGYTTLDIKVTEVQPNAAVTITPAAPGGQAPPAAGAQPLPTEQVGEGIYLLLGAGAVSIAFDFGEYSVVLEAPGDERRSAAVIAETRRLIPGKPIRYIINTHQHFDHTGGLRTFVAEGATVVTHRINKAYFERVFAPAHTLNRALDARQQGRLRVKVDPVDDKKVLSGGNQTIELYHVQGNRHNGGMLMAYLPKQKILIQADMWGAPAPGAAPAPVSIYTMNFLENLDRLKLDIERIVPIHYPTDGRGMSFQDMMRSVGRAP